MGLVEVLDYPLWAIKDIGFHPLLIGICFALWLLVWNASGNRLSSGVFGFSLFFAALWLLWLVEILFIAITGATLNWEANRVTFLKMALALALFAACAFVSWLSLARRRPLHWPTAIVGALIMAHALHLSVIATITNKWLDI